MTAKNTFNHSNFKDSTSTAWHVVVQATGQIPYVKCKMYSWQAPEHVCENVMLEQHSSTTLPSTGETGITQTQSVAALLLEACPICPLSTAACLLSNATHGACLLSYDIPPCHLSPASWVIAYGEALSNNCWPLLLPLPFNLLKHCSMPVEVKIQSYCCWVDRQGYCRLESLGCNQICPC